MAQATAGLILAGGAGVRYGVPKAFATLPDGRTFLAACAHALTGAGALPLLATLPPGATAGLASGITELPLPFAGMEMFESLRCGLHELTRAPAWSVVAVLPVDHPLVQPESVVRLASVVAPAAVPVFRGKRGHPVCLSRATAEAIASGALAGPTLREVLRAVGRTDVPVDDPGVVANCNTPEALATFLRDLSPPAAE